MGLHDAQKVAELWGDEDRFAYYEGGGLNWAQLEAVRRRMSAKISGDPAVDWIDHLKATHLQDRTPVERCLSLGCGRGSLERDLAARGVFKYCIGYDISEGALAQARALAAESGYTHIEYVAADLNTIELPCSQFDLIVSRGALHHLSALEDVTAQINRALKPDGLLVVADYMGPTRLAYSARRLEICDAALQLLPKRFRRSVSWQRRGRVGYGAKRSPADWARLAWLKLRNQTLVRALGTRLRHARLRATGRLLVKQRVARVVASELAVDDPSEAVRSADIRTVLESALNTIEYKPYGSSILMPVLDDIAGNFERDDPVADRLLEMLFEIEDALMEAGEIESDFAYIVAAKHQGTD